MALEDVKEFFQSVSAIIRFMPHFFIAVLPPQVDWTEPWLVILLCLHAATTAAIILARRQSYIQACILGVLGEG